MNLLRIASQLLERDEPQLARLILHIAGNEKEREKTKQHINKVASYMHKLSSAINTRATQHDASKLEEPEASVYEAVTPEFEGKEYGTPEYKEVARKLGPAWQHHVKVNTHHPEHFSNGVSGMTLVDLVEMLCDWKAASERGGNNLSISDNSKRFGIDGQLASILTNTLGEL